MTYFFIGQGRGLAPSPPPGSATDTFLKTDASNFYRPLRSCKGYVLTPVSLSTGGVYLNACWDTTTTTLPLQTPTEADTPQSRHPLEQIPQEQTPPRSRHSPSRHPHPQADTSPVADTSGADTLPTPLEQTAPLGADTPLQEQTPPQSRRLLLRTVRIQLECILVCYVL